MPENARKKVRRYTCICQKECRIECLKGKNARENVRILVPEILSEEMPRRMPDRMSRRVPERMSDRTSGRTVNKNRMPYVLLDDMPEITSQYITIMFQGGDCWQN